MSNYNVLFDAQAAAEEVIPRVVARHRSKGILTWKLLHRMEEEVLAEVSSSGVFNEQLLRMICAPAALDYPNDDRPASFDGHDFVPIVFGSLERAWRRVN